MPKRRLGRGALCAPAVGAWTYQGMVLRPHARCQNGVWVGERSALPPSAHGRSMASSGDPMHDAYQGSVRVMYDDTVRRLDVRY
jgi:hypothetical protein